MALLTKKFRALVGSSTLSAHLPHYNVRQTTPYPLLDGTLIPFPYLSAEDKRNVLIYNTGGGKLPSVHRSVWRLRYIPSSHIYKKEKAAIDKALREQSARVATWRIALLGGGGGGGVRQALIRGMQFALKAALVVPPPPANDNNARAFSEIFNTIINSTTNECEKAMAALDALPPPPVKTAYAPYAMCLEYAGPLQRYRSPLIVYTGRHCFDTLLRYANLTPWEQYAVQHTTTKNKRGEVREGLWVLRRQSVHTLYMEDPQGIEKAYARLRSERTLRNLFTNTKTTPTTPTPTTRQLLVAQFDAARTKLARYDSQAEAHIKYHALVQYAKPQLDLKAWLIYETTVPHVPVLVRVR